MTSSKEILKKVEAHYTVNKILAAFEIIKEKKVNVGDFVNTCSRMSYEQYKFMWKEGCFMGVKMTSKEFLAEEEYYLLKEVLL